MGKPSLRIICNTSEFITLRDTWNDLLIRSSSNTVFLTWEWMYTWWSCFGKGKELCIIIAEDEGSIVGIAPLHIIRERIFGLSTLRHIEFLGSTGIITEYQDFIILQGREQEIVNIFMDFLFSRTIEWDAMNFVSMKQDGLNNKLILNYCDNREIKYSVYNTNVSPYIELPPNFDEYMQSLSRNSRWRFKSLKKKLGNGRKVEIVETKDKTTVASDFSTIMHLHQIRWEDKGGDGSFAKHRAQYLRFHSEVVQKFYDNGWLYLLQLKVDGVPVAGQYNFFYHNVVCYHSVGFDPEWAEHNVGSVLQLNAIEDSIQKGAKEFDFLRGTEQYKYLWAKYEHISVDTVIWRSIKIERRVAVERKIRRTMKSLFPKSLAEKIYLRMFNRGT
jgi:CelD/BcsL family acetyltransferase involved in cellulose biosynthesis